MSKTPDLSTEREGYVASVNLYLDGENALSGQLSPYDRVIQKHHIDITCLPDGTMDGKPTVGFHIQYGPGEHVFAEITLALFLTAADALKARYGDPRE